MRTRCSFADGASARASRRSRKTLPAQTEIMSGLRPVEIHLVGDRRGRNAALIGGLLAILVLYVVPARCARATYDRGIVIPVSGASARSC